MAKESLPQGIVPDPQLLRFQIPAAGNFDNPTLLEVALAGMVALVWHYKPLCYDYNMSPESAGWQSRVCMVVDGQLMLLFRR